MASHRITLQVEGALPGQDNVWLSDFVRELEALRTALRRTEEASTGKAVLDWQIVDLRHDSPAMVTIEPVYAQAEIPDGQAQAIEERKAMLVGSFFRNVRSISANEVPPELDRTTLEAYQELAAPVRQQRLRAKLSNGSEPQVVIEPIMQDVVEILLSPTTQSSGTVKGRLEFFNIHSDQNVFRIYSPLIPRWVACHFPEEHTATAKEAIGRKVRVSGEVTYRTRDPYPHAIEVKHIAVLPEDSLLPPLLSLRGTDLTATGDQSSEDFVKALRVE